MVTLWLLWKLVKTKKYFGGGVSVTSRAAGGKMRAPPGVLLQGRFSGCGLWWVGPGAPGLRSQTAPCLGRASQPPPQPALSVDTALELRAPCPSAALPRPRSQLTSHRAGGQPGSVVPRWRTTIWFRGQSGARHSPLRGQPPRPCCHSRLVSAGASMLPEHLCVRSFQNRMRLKKRQGNLRCFQAPRDPHTAPAPVYHHKTHLPPCPPAPSLWGWSSPGVLGLCCSIASLATLSPPGLKLGSRRVRGETTLWPGS